MHRKLRRKGFTDAAIATVLDELTEAGWLSDERYCESLLRQRMRQGQGPQRVAWDLGQQGMEAATIATLLATIDETEWMEIASAVLDKRYGSEAGADYARQANFLRRRGFSSAQIGQVMKARRRGGAPDDI